MGKSWILFVLKMVDLYVKYKSGKEYTITCHRYDNGKKEPGKLLIYNKDSPDKGIAEIWIKKHRNGPTGMIKLGFRGKYTRFDNLSQAEYGR